MIKEKTKQIIKAWIAMFVILVILVIVAVAIMKYEIEGEKSMPFTLSKITIISTAEGIQKTNQENKSTKWNFDIIQNNDIYFSIDKNDEYKEEDILKSFTIENIHITRTPTKGNMRIYMPNSSEGRLYSYEEEYLILDNLQYKGALKSNPKTLEIGNQGGTALIRFSNANIGEYISDEETQIKHDGTLLQKINISEEEISFEVNFDIILEVKDKKYKANVSLNLPYEHIIEKGTTTIEKTDMSGIIFKRI